MDNYFRNDKRLDSKKYCLLLLWKFLSPFWGSFSKLIEWFYGFKCARQAKVAEFFIYTYHQTYTYHMPKQSGYFSKLYLFFFPFFIIELTIK